MTGIVLEPTDKFVVFEEVDYVRATIRVIEHRRLEYGPPAEIAAGRQIETIVAPLPPRALEGCRASAFRLAYMLTLKYWLHLPLYRQEVVFKQAGFVILRQTLCDWVLKAAFALRPIANAIEVLIRAGPVLQIDDTPVKCQAGKGQGTRKGIRQAYLWTLVNPDVPGVAFRDNLDFQNGVQTYLATLPIASM